MSFEVRVATAQEWEQLEQFERQMREHHNLLEPSVAQERTSLFPKELSFSSFRRINAAYPERIVKEFARELDEAETVKRVPDEWR